MIDLTGLQIRMRIKSSTEYEVEGESTVTSCVCARDSVTNDFNVRLTSIGDVNLTISVCISSRISRYSV